MPKNSNSLGIIPARFASSRFPGKPLANIAGKTMIMRVYEQVLKSVKLNFVLVATDDERIFEHVQNKGGNVLMTSTSHQTGTDRCIEVVRREEYGSFDIVVNIQGDEPLIHPEQIDSCIEILENNETISISTLVKRIENQEDLFNPNIVKVVSDNCDRAMYFSRGVLPWRRNLLHDDWMKSVEYYKHIGIYGFRKHTLLELANLKPGKLESAELLEQLRWLENGYQIGVAVTNCPSHPVDIPGDVDKILKLLNDPKN